MFTSPAPRSPRDTRRRIEEINSSIESITKVINTMRRDDRVYFNAKMMTIELKKQKMLALSTVAETQSMARVLAEMDVLVAENDLVVEIETIKRAKKFKKMEKCLLTESSTSMEDPDKTVLIEVIPHSTPIKVETSTPSTFDKACNLKDAVTAANLLAIKEKHTKETDITNTSIDLKELPKEIDAGSTSGNNETAVGDNINTTKTDPHELKSHKDVMNLYRSYKKIHSPAKLSPRSEHSTKNVVDVSKSSHKSNKIELDAKTTINSDNMNLSVSKKTLHEPKSSPETSTKDAIQSHSQETLTRKTNKSYDSSVSDYKRKTLHDSAESSRKKVKNDHSSTKTDTKKDGKSHDNSKLNKKDRKYKSLDSSVKKNELISSSSGSTDKNHPVPSPNIGKKYDDFKSLKVANIDIFDHLFGPSTKKDKKSRDSTSQPKSSKKHNKRSHKPTGHTTKKTDSESPSIATIKSDAQNSNDSILNDDEAFSYMNRMVQLEMEKKAFVQQTQDDMVNDLFRDLMASKMIKMETESLSDKTGNCFQCGPVSEDHVCAYTIRVLLEQC